MNAAVPPLPLSPAFTLLALPPLISAWPNWVEKGRENEKEQRKGRRKTMQSVNYGWVYAVDEHDDDDDDDDAVGGVFDDDAVGNFFVCASLPRRRT